MRENDNYDEYEEDYPDDDIDTDDIPHAPTFATGNEDIPPVSDQELIDRWTNKNTKFQKYILEEIENSNLLTDTKSGLKRFVYTYFNPTMFFANFSPQRGNSWMSSGFDPQRYARLLSQLLLLKNRVMYHPADLNSSELLIISQAMKNHLEIIITRTVGDEREAIINRETRTKGEQIVTNKEKQIMKTHEKRKRIGGMI